MIQTIAVLGAGTMGHGIAHTFSRHGYQVNLYEPFDAVRESAPQKIREELQFMVDEGYITEADRDTGISNITMCSDLETAARDADYIIEACPEKMELKQQLFAQLDGFCKPTAVFATNTSSLKLREMIAHLPPERQARCMVSHWYNPAYLIPIAELSKFGNMPEDIDKALKYGPCFRNATTGMLEVADMGGLDVWLAAEDNMFPALCTSDKACDAMRTLVDQGKLGIKSGEGFFSYPEEKRAAAQTEFYKRLIVQLKASKNY